MRKEDDEVEITCEILHETENAIKIHDYFSEGEHWLPLSQISQIRREPSTPYATISIKTWIAKTKGLI